MTLACAVLHQGVHREVCFVVHTVCSAGCGVYFCVCRLCCVQTVLCADCAVCGLCCVWTVQCADCAVCRLCSVRTLQCAHCAVCRRCRRCSVSFAAACSSWQPWSPTPAQDNGPGNHLYQQRHDHRSIKLEFFPSQGALWHYWTTSRPQLDN